MKEMLEGMFEILNEFFDKDGVFTATEMDLVPVVRCKYCKYFDMSTPHSTSMPNFYKCKRLAAVYMEPDAFCSYGERKGDAE